MKFRTEIEIPVYDHYDYKINYNNSLFFIGSCFSANMGNRCIKRGIDTMINPFGVTYNPISVSKILKYIEDGGTMEDFMYHKVGNRWCSMMHDSSFDCEYLSDLQESVSKSISSTGEHISKSSHLFITLGTSWVFEDLYIGEIINNCHKMKSEEFSRRRLTVKEIVNSLSFAIENYQILKNKKIIFTVSPIRHLKDTLQGNGLSKATLRCAVDELCQKYPTRVFYFPSYEIMMDDLRDYRFYETDMIHLSESAIDYVFEIFEKCFFTPETSDYGKRMEKVTRAMNHIVINEGSEAHLLFKQNMRDKIENIKKQYPLVDYTEKLDFFK